MHKPFSKARTSDSIFSISWHEEIHRFRYSIEPSHRRSFRFLIYMRCIACGHIIGKYQDWESTGWYGHPISTSNTLSNYISQFKTGNSPLLFSPSFLAYESSARQRENPSTRFIIEYPTHHRYQKAFPANSSPVSIYILGLSLKILDFR